MILRYMKKREWCIIGIMAVFTYAQVYLELEIPGYMSSITTILNVGGTVEDMAPYGRDMLICAILALAASIVTRFLISYLASGFGCRLRSMEFDRVQSFSMADMNRFSPASLITRSTNDVTQVQTMLSMATLVLLKAPFIVIWGLYKIIGSGWEWTSATAVGVMLVVMVQCIIIFVVVPKFRRMQWLTDDMNSVTSEHLTGIRVIRAYNAEEYQKKKFDEANDALTRNTLFTSRSMSMLLPFIGIIQNMLTLTIYIIGAVIINAAELGDRLTLFSDMVVFSSYTMQILMAFMLIGDVFIVVPRSMVAANRIEELIETEPSIKDGPMTDAPEGVEGEIEFRNVSFRYDEEGGDVLRDISFKACRGEVVAIIGSTGCGKSSLVNLIPRFYDVSNGTVLVDGADVREYRLDVLRSKIGYVPQRAVLFSGPISYNVNYGSGSEDRTDEDIRKALAVAQGTEFVERIPEGYDGRISEYGRNLSGGQKQRISIARAVCRRPEIYIFDDSFSALDYRTDHNLRKALHEEAEGSTVIIVAQRVGTIRDADRIIVIDNGEVVGNGTHSELMKGCEVYREIALSQLTEEELRD